MARKGKKRKRQLKKKRQRKNFNKSEFQTVFCQTCLICPKKCDFCYELYKHEPKQFISDVFNNLVDTHAVYQTTGRILKMLPIEQFQNIFCKTGICYNGDGYASAGCDQLNECYKSFKKQMGMHNPAIVTDPTGETLINFGVGKSKRKYVAPARRGKKKKKARYVPVSYTSFFSRDNDDFKAEVKRILYGDNDSEQDSNQELSADSAGAVDRPAKDRQS